MKGGGYLKILSSICLDNIHWTEVVVWLYDQVMEEDAEKEGNAEYQL